MSNIVFRNIVFRLIWLLLFQYFSGIVLSQRKDLLEETIETYRNSEGVWKKDLFCPENTYLNGYIIREYYQSLLSFGQSVNGIEFSCTNIDFNINFRISPEVGCIDEPDYRSSFYCPRGTSFMTGFCIEQFITGELSFRGVCSDVNDEYFSYLGKNTFCFFILPCFANN